MSDFVTTDIYIHNKTITHIMVTSVEFSSGGTNPTLPILTFDICVNTISWCGGNNACFYGLICAYLQPAVSVRFVNPQPCSGLFETRLPIYQGDTLQQVINRLMKTDRSKMKGKLWSFMIKDLSSSLGPYGYSSMNKTKYTKATLEIPWWLVNPILKALVMHI